MTATIPDIWRTEVFHALSVHFPIVLILLATALYSFHFFKKQEVLATTQWIVWVATLATWISIYTGNQADGIVSRQICDPTILKKHQNLSETLGYLMILISIIQLGYFFLKNKVILVLLLLLLLSSAILTTLTGHLGASLVYQQAAGTYVPSDNCREFN